MYLLYLRSVALAAVILLLVSSCKKNINGVISPNADTAATMSQVFEDYWNGMNNNYVFWDVETTNWDDVYRKFQPMFARLDINNTQDVLTGYSYMQQMTSTLTDCHYNISFTNPVLKDSSIDPAATRKAAFIEQSLAHIRGYFDNILYRTYLDVATRTFATDIYTTSTGSKSTFEIVTGTIGAHTVYLRINQFHLDASLTNTTVAAVWNKYLGYLRQPGVDGLIIDLRSNNGGYLSDLNLVCGTLIDQPLHFGYTKQKSANGRLDYTPWAPAMVTPASGYAALQVPIVVLTDRNSISMAESTTMALKCLPNTYVIGDTTWGANGPLTSDIGLFGGGQFTFGHFGFVYTSTSQFKYINNEIYENRGFPPDSHIPYNADSVKVGRDIQLSEAIKYISTH